jgi:hypothetical protein
LLVRDSGDVFASTRGDGVWQQVDKSGGGRTGGWAKPCYGRPGPGKTHAIAVDPQDPDTIYAGTEPIGFWVTHDAGKNWESLPALWAIPEVRAFGYPVPFVEPHVRHIAIDPNDRDVLYLSMQIGYVAKSTDRGRSWRIIDGGIDADVHTIVIHPKNSQKLFAATGGHGCRQGVTRGKALYTSDDGGETWSPMATEFVEEYSVSLVLHPEDPDALFSAVAVGPPPAWHRPDGAKARFIRSRDGGRSWQQVELPDANVGHEFPGAIAFDPSDVTRVFMSTDQGSFYRSADGGQRWSRVPVELDKVGDLTEIGLSDMKIVGS